MSPHVRASFTGRRLPSESVRFRVRNEPGGAMTSPDTSRRIWAMTIRRFAEMAWSDHGPMRYGSVVLTPILVAFLVPGYWWVACLLGAIAGVLIDLRTQAAFDRLSLRLDELDAATLKAMIGKYVAALAATTACYVAPY